MTVIIVFHYIIFMKNSDYNQLRRLWLATTASFLVTACVNAQDGKVQDMQAPPGGSDEPNILIEAFRESKFGKWDESHDSVLPPPIFPTPEFTVGSGPLEKHDNQPESEAEKKGHPRP